MENYFITVSVVFVILLGGMPILAYVSRLFGVYDIVQERECNIYVLFGNVIGKIDKPGLYFLWFKLGWKALFVMWLGKRFRVSLQLDQEYLRSQPVNSEEGAPMGIGIWYEMYISNPQAFLFRNIDPRGSLSANVSNSTVRCLSNLPLEKMMSDRHSMSQAVREEVSPKSNEWGYKLGSCYIRKVHFRDSGMIGHIESKVVNRLRQVTSAIKQDGINQVNIISSTAERVAAIEFGKANAIRPKIVGTAIKKICQDDEVASAMFKILENNRIISSKAKIALVPKGNELLTQMMVVKEKEE